VPVKTSYHVEKRYAPSTELLRGHAVQQPSEWDRRTDGRTDRSTAIWSSQPTVGRAGVKSYREIYVLL